MKNLRMFIALIVFGTAATALAQQRCYPIWIKEPIMTMKDGSTGYEWVEHRVCE